MSDYFVKKVAAVKWNDPTFAQGKRRFVAYYRFEKGFSCIEDAKQHLLKKGLKAECFVFIHYLRWWYPVNMYKYHEWAVITPGNTYFSDSEGYTVHSSQDFSEGLKAFNAGEKKWADGIVRDLKMTGTVSVFDFGGKLIDDPITANNAIVVFGIPFFINEVCITNLNYLSHIAAHYYNQRSQKNLYQHVKYLIGTGQQFYNFFSKSVSETEYKKNKKRKELLATAEVDNNVYDTRPAGWLNEADLLAEQNRLATMWS